MKEVIRQFGRTIIAAIVCMAMFTFLGKVPAQIGKELLSQEIVDDSGENSKKGSEESSEEGSEEYSEENGIGTDSAAGDTAAENIHEEEYDLQVLTQKLWCGQNYTASDLVRITTGSGAPVSVQVEAVWKEKTEAEKTDQETTDIICSSTGFCIAGPGCYEVLLSYPAGGRTDYIQVTVLINRRYR